MTKRRGGGFVFIYIAARRLISTFACYLCDVNYIRLYNAYLHKLLYMLPIISGECIL